MEPELKDAEYFKKVLCELVDELGQSFDYLQKDFKEMCKNPNDDTSFLEFLEKHFLSDQHLHNFIQPYFKAFERLKLHDINDLIQIRNHHEWFAGKHFITQNIYSNYVIFHFTDVDTHTEKLTKFESEWDKFLIELDEKHNKFFSPNDDIRPSNCDVCC